MGLDCIIKYYNGNEYSCMLPEEIANKLKLINSYGIIGYSVREYNNNHYFVGFRGRPYYNIIENLTECSLYDDLQPNELNSMYVKLKNKLKDFDCIKEVQKAYNDTWNLTDWTTILTDMYIPSPDEIIGLMELFRICYENNLMLYACY